MLLSLPSPNVICFKEQKNFLWCGKSPKCRKEILKGEIYHGGLKLNNLPLCDKALKLSWLKRYINSRSQWTVFPNNFDLWEAFINGSEFPEKNIKTTSNKFWLDVFERLLLLWKTEAVLGQDVIKNMPIWLKPTFSIPIHSDWFNKGISTIANFLSPIRAIMPMTGYMETYNLKANFKEYSSITIKIKKFIEWKEMPLYEEFIEWREMSLYEEFIEWREMPLYEEFIEWREMPLYEEFIEWKEMPLYEEFIEWKEMPLYEEFIEWKETPLYEEFIEWKEMPLYEELASRNNSLNVLLNLSANGCL